MRFSHVLFVLLLLAGCRSEVRYPAGMLAPRAPVQEVSHDAPLLSHADYVIEPVARFEVEARVLGAKRYRSGRESELSPVDLALGWGPMSDQANLDAIDISQSRRFYYWRSSRMPLPRRVIAEHSANMHLIPADDAVREALLRVRAGEVVRFRGYLVDVRASDGWRWRSSRTRKDVGGGACELVWVEELLSYEAPGVIR